MKHKTHNKINLKNKKTINKKAKKNIKINKYDKNRKYKNKHNNLFNLSKKFIEYIIYNDLIFKTISIKNTCRKLKISKHRFNYIKKVLNGKL